jgi:hypothetical protein
MTAEPTDVDEVAPRTPSAARWAVLASGALLVVGSFLPLYTSERPDGGVGSAGDAILDAVIETSWTSWSNAWSIVPLVPLVVVVLPVLATLWLAAGSLLPDRLGPVAAAAARTAVGVLAVLTIVAYLLRSLSADDAGDAIDLGSGAWVLLVGAALHLGAVVAAGWSEPAPPPEPRPVPEDELASTALLVTLGAAVVAVAGSFLPALTFVDELSETPSEATTLAWGDGLRPVFALPAIAAIAVVVVLLAHQRGTSAPLAVAWSTWRLAVSAFAVVASVSLLVGNALWGGFGDLADVRAGQWVMFAGAVGMLAGTLTDRRRPDRR